MKEKNIKPKKTKIKVSKNMNNFSNNLDNWLPTSKLNAEKDTSNTRQGVVDYFKYPAVNNSLLNLIAGNPYWIQWRKENPDIEDEEKRYFRIGSAVDCLLTDPDSFDSEFVISDVKRPSGLMGPFVDALPKNITEESPIEDYQVAYDKSGYKSKIDTVISKFWSNPEFFAYYKQKQETDKILLSKDEYDEVKYAIENIVFSKYTHEYFVNTYDDNKKIERIFQKPIFFYYNKIECKALLDGILINHTDKTIQPFDLKTTMDAYEFEKSFYLFSYFRQCAFYHMALQYMIQNEEEYLYLQEYKILPFKFIVSPKKENHPALIYEVSEEILNKGLDGAYYQGKFYPGLLKLLDDYNWHVSNNYWLTRRDIYENDYVIKLK